MNAHPNPKKFSTPRSQPIQTALQLENPEGPRRIPDEKRSECIALIRELIEAVADRPALHAGGTNE
jgi:hypothetical protein